MAHSVEGRQANRLIDETSPYLLQHAHNPVDWYPWGDEALAAARESNRPLLLSIGYAACHWCHVMERESFEDPEIAELMNKWFLCIKVDREERPDIDSIYMDAVQAMTGQGGWPMTVFASPEGIPFYGGTYFPPQDRPGLPSFRRILQAIHNAWVERGEEMVEQAHQLVDQITAANKQPASDEPLSDELLAGALAKIATAFDRRNGGFGGAPKFPQPPVLELVLRGVRNGGEPYREMIDLTLRKMAMGGIYDQVGGGFARYTVDASWLTPHFEKMLYDNAQLARVYTHAWQLAGTDLYRRIAIETLEYLIRDMRDPNGGFYSSEDADSEGHEGKFYVWSFEELNSLAPEAAGYYGVTPEGNFEGTNILTAGSDDPPAARERLMSVRSRRVRPHRDEKILTSWNALTITALAEAGAALNRDDFVQHARDAAGLLLEKAAGDAGRLFHSYKDGRATVLGLLEDYAYLAEALLALWEVTFEPEWFGAAQKVVAQMVELFWDAAEGGFFTTGNDHEKLIMRQKELVESVTPSPNAIAALVLQKMSVLTGDESLVERAEKVMRLAYALMTRVPRAASSFLSCLDFWLSTPKEIAIVGEGERAEALAAEVWKRFIPNKVVAGSPPGIESPMLEDKVAIRGIPTAFVCEHRFCRAPTQDPAELAAQLS
jgi:uncharacterized protein